MDNGKASIYNNAANGEASCCVNCLLIKNQTISKIVKYALLQLCIMRKFCKILYLFCVPTK